MLEYASEAMTSNLQHLIRRLNMLHQKHKNWRAVASLEEFDGIAPGTLCSIAKGNYEPRDNKIRKKLGLPIVVVQYKDPKTGRFVERGR